MPIQNDKQRLNVSADEPISVTVDASDLSVASAEPLRNILSRYGHPVVARAFADFQLPGAADLAVQLYQMGFTLVHCPTWPNGDGAPKPVVSDVMAQDLRDQLEDLGEEVETYLVVATSRDFIAVANALRRHDRRVVVVAEEAKVCRELRLCADEYAILAHSRPERESSRSGRSVEAARAERPAEMARVERPETARVERVAEPVSVERRVEPVRVARRAAPARVERPVEPVRVEPPVEPMRAERPVELVRVEPPVEPARVERPVEPARAERAESQDAARLPSDAEVLAEVRRIVAAEGICTPRRLARALCPVDRTATGELRSRIANRIQALVDAGKLQREKLVVGGTSVETILARDERNGRATRAATPEAAGPSGPTASMPSSTEPEPNGLLGGLMVDGMIQGEPVPELVADSTAAEEEKSEGKAGVLPADDLDALIESVLRSSGLAAGLLGREVEPSSLPEPVASMEPAPVSASEVGPELEPTLATEEPAPVVHEPPKRTRSRRRTSPRVPAPEANGAA